MRRVRSGGVAQAFSAGSHPKPMHPSALGVIRDERELDLTSMTSKHLDVFAEQHFDRVITLGWG